MGFIEKASFTNTEIHERCHGLLFDDRPRKLTIGGD